MSPPARFAVVGHPVAGSLSPAMHNAAFAAVGLEAVYEARDIQDPRELADLFEPAAGYSGLNVTVPFKTAAAELCGELSIEARLAGAVNTVVFGGPVVPAGPGETLRPRGSRPVSGYNTDVLALLALLREHGALVGGRRLRVAVLGAGGAARAAAAAAALAGAEEIVLAARAAERAREVAADLARRWEREGGADLGPGGGRGRTRFRGAALGELVPGVLDGGFAAVFQATSAPDGTIVGLGPLRRSDLPGSLGRAVRPPVLAVELNYRPPRTAFLAEAEAAGARVVDGLEVLVRQGEEAFRLFTGRPAPPGVMRQAVGPGRGKRAAEPGSEARAGRTGSGRGEVGCPDS